MTGYYNVKRIFQKTFDVSLKNHVKAVTSIAPD